MRVIARVHLWLHHTEHCIKRVGQGEVGGKPSSKVYLCLYSVCMWMVSNTSTIQNSRYVGISYKNMHNYAILLCNLSPPLSTLGLPNPPTGLISSPQATNTLRLQWEAPFSLPGENISYILHTRNLRTNETVSRVTVTGTSTTFERPQEDQVHDRYEFTVCSNNAVGPSENCATVEASIPSGKHTELSVSHKKVFRMKTSACREEPLKTR